jgi:tetratricopeptide (TPR) repeat protein
MKLTRLGRMFARKKQTLHIRAEADLLRDSRAWIDAAKLYRDYLKLRPQDAAIWVQLGHCEKEAGHLDAADDSYHRAATLTPKDPDIWLQIGHLRKRQGRISDAISSYKLALAADPAIEAAHKELEFYNQVDDSTELDQTASETTESFSVNDLHQAMRRIPQVEEHVAIQGGHIERLLQLTSTVNALSFGLAGQERRTTELASSIDREAPIAPELEQAVRRLERIEEHIATYGSHLERLLQLTSSVNALGFEFARQKQQTLELTSGIEAIVTELSSKFARQEQQTAELVGQINQFEIAIPILNIAVDEGARRQEETRHALEALDSRIEAIAGDATANTRANGELSDRLAQISHELPATVNSALESVSSRIEAIAGEATANTRATGELSDRVAQISHELPATVIAALESVNSRIEAVAGEAKASTHATGDLSERLAQMSHKFPTTVSSALESVNLRIESIASEAKANTRATGVLSEHLMQMSHELPETMKSTNGSLSRLSDAERQIGELWNRVEFVRREVMLEFSHGRAQHDSLEDTLKIEAKILSPDKLRAATTSGLKLNIGCGHISLPDYINIDRRELPGVDILAEADEIPLPVKSVDEIYSAHVLEHFPQEMLIRRVLPAWHRLLKPGGRLVSIVPDGDAMARSYSAGTYPIENFREVLFGSQEYSGNYHFNLFTPTTLEGLLTNAGFEEFTLVAAGRPNGNCFEFECHAVRGHDRVRRSKRT